MLTRISLLFCLLLSIIVQLGCIKTPVGSSAPIPADAGQTCQDYCGEIGMVLSAVAIMADNIGCVCEPTSKSTQLDKEAASSAGGMVTVLLQQQAEERQQQQQAEERQQQQQQQQSNYYN